MRYCASVVVTAAEFGLSCGCSERVTLWSVRVWAAYVLCALPLLGAARVVASCAPKHSGVLRMQSRRCGVVAPAMQMQSMACPDCSCSQFVCRARIFAYRNTSCVAK
jgi:hypothetical protein